MGYQSSPGRVFSITLTYDYLTHTPEWLSAFPPEIKTDRGGLTAKASVLAIGGTVSKARQVFPTAKYQYVDTKRGVRPCLVFVEVSPHAATLPPTPSEDIIKHVQDAIGLKRKAHWYLLTT